MSSPVRRGPVLPAKPVGKPSAPVSSGNTGGRPPSSPRPVPASSGSGGGGLSLVLLLLMLAGLGLCYTLAFTSDACDAKIPASGTSVPNLKNLLAVGLSSGQHLTITEPEINGYLAATLKARQGGPLAERAPLRRVAVRLRDGDLHLVMVRQVFGREHCVTVRLTPSQIVSGGDRVWNVQPSGGSIGKLPVAGGLLALVLAPVNQLAAIYRDELKILRHASSVRVESGRVLLGPVVVKQ
ncbi:MAG: hypothetical protein ACKO2G_05115 [Verrucomicrobiales bacterium]